MKLEGLRVVVTGGNSGIGHAILLELLRRPNNRVLVVDRRIDEVPQRPNVQTLVADLSERAGTDLAVDAALAWMGGIDLYFANAGFAYYEQLGGPNWQRLERIYEVNVLAPLYGFQKVREAAGSRPFRVVLTASAMGYLPIPGYAVYGATKASLVNFVKAMRFELEDPASLTLLNPIATRTAFFGQAEASSPTPFPSQTPETVAAHVMKALARDQPDIFPSYLFRALWLVQRAFPVVGWAYQKQQQAILSRWAQRQRRSSSG